MHGPTSLMWYVRANVDVTCKNAPYFTWAHEYTAPLFIHLSITIVIQCHQLCHKRSWVKQAFRPVRRGEAGKTLHINKVRFIPQFVSCDTKVRLKFTALFSSNLCVARSAWFVRFVFSNYYRGIQLCMYVGKFEERWGKKIPTTAPRKR
jgi:hypothetical protein